MYYYRKDLEEKRKNWVNVPRQKTMLCLNESPKNPFEIVQDTFLEKMKNSHLNRYFSEVTNQLYLKLASYIGYSITPQNILFGNGADEMLYYLFTALNDKDSFILSLSPSYFDYKSYSSSVGLDIKFHYLDNDFGFSTEELLRKSSDRNCKMIILCNPNNPTGNIFDDEQIIYVIENTDKLVLIDEAYFEFSKKTFVDKIAKYDNLIILRTFSKGFSSAGLRFGYLISQKQNIDEIQKVFTVFNSSILVQNFALSMLEHKEKFEEVNESLITERENLYQNMKELQIEVIKSYTNFLSFNLGKKSIPFFHYLQE
ncbi:MAG: aminotransferase class I/II-fold pyridoxal phosphate-dependent enzyme, partial [Candidatus Cloacimonadota bacterium]|nr:aminotransferase class I/II-fold pyridoxal phosphate-dependent enzyme [Candidatus Cloacimonadota bacterium]